MFIVLQWLYAVSKNFNSEYDLYTVTVYDIDNVCKYFCASDADWDLPTRIWPFTENLFSHLSSLTNKFLISNVYNDIE